LTSSKGSFCHFCFIEPNSFHVHRETSPFFNISKFATFLKVREIPLLAIYSMLKSVLCSLMLLGDYFSPFHVEEINGTRFFWSWSRFHAYKFAIFSSPLVFLFARCPPPSLMVVDRSTPPTSCPINGDLGFWPTSVPLSVSFSMLIRTYIELRFLFPGVFGPLHSTPFE